MTGMTPVAAPCRSCAAHLGLFLSLGKLPLPDAFVRPDQLTRPEPRFPVDVAFCTSCSLVQLVGDVPAETMFADNYLYFSSFSDLLLDHARRHVSELIESRKLGPDSLVVELASNDGYLLRNFVEAGIPVLGIDPSAPQAAVAEAHGIPTLVEFFTLELADRLVAEGKRADVIIANNVMAHVPDLNSFVAGMSRLIADDGLITVENPGIRSVIEGGAFDTIYHEHVCYYSCTSVESLVARHGLYLNHVEEYPELHGGTLRWNIAPWEDRSETAHRYLIEEREEGLTDSSYYADFAARVESIRLELLTLLRGLKAQGHSIAAYGAAAKGTVLLNYVGIDASLVDFVVDRNTYKQGLHMPGVHLPIVAPETLLDMQPDFTLLLAWNFSDEIVAQQQEYLRRGGRFIRPIPRPEILA